MPTRISPQAIVHPHAQLDYDVEIGPFCVVGSEVSLGRGTRLLQQVSLQGRTSMGRYNVVHPQVVLGTSPPAPGPESDAPELVIGNGNTFRELAVAAGGVRTEGSLTVLGDGCWFGPGVQIARGCRVSDCVRAEGGSLLGPHTHIAESAHLGRGVVTHAVVSVGALAAAADAAHLVQDCPPYLEVEGSPARPRRVNAQQLRTAGVAPYAIEGLNEAYRLIYDVKLGLDRVRESLRSRSLLHPPVNHLLSVLQLQYEGRHGRSRQQARRYAA